MEEPMSSVIDKYPSINLSDYLAPEGMTLDEFEGRLHEPLFRLCNLYSITDKEAATVKFTPTWPQCVVLHSVFVEGRQRIAIPKARQLGFSTLIAIIAFDKAYFGDGQQCSIVDRTRDDAEAKLDKVAFAFKHLDPELREGAGLIVEKNSQMAWSNGGSVAAGKNARGGTNQLLHISEWGVIAYEDPKRSAEIVSGAIPSCSGLNSIIFGESTYKGGRGGDWYQVLRSGMECSDEDRTVLDWTVLFFEWFLEPAYTLEGSLNRLTPQDHKYFAEMEKETGYTFTDGQKLWYVVTRDIVQGRWMPREYPTVMSEMWSVREEGQIYASMLDKARVDGRISNDVRYYEQLPVYAALDIGAPENTKCVIFQVVADRIVYLEAKSGGDDIITPLDWIKWMTGKTYRFGSIFMPHDAEAVWLPLFKQMGVTTAVCLKRPMSVWDNIIYAQTQFSRCEFHKDGCHVSDGKDDVGLVGSLESFHCVMEKDGQTVKEVPLHDWSSHFSTCFGYSHQAMKDGMLVDRSAIPVMQGTPRKPRVSMGRRRR
jgi:hypothetical protein